MNVIAPASARATALPASDAPRSVATRARWLRGLAVLIATLLLTDLLLHLHTGSTVVTSWWAGDIVLAVTLGAPGILVVQKRPGNAVGWLFLVAAVTTALSGAGREYLVYGLLGGSAPGWLWVGWFTDSLFVVAMGSLPLTLMLFPDGRPLSRRAQPLLALPGAMVLVGIFGQLLGKPTDLEIRGRVLRSPVTEVLPGPVAVAQAIWWPLLALSMACAILTVVQRYRRSVGAERQQLKWITWAGSIVALELVSETIVPDSVATITGPLAVLLFTTSVSIAILRHHLLDIDLVINRTLVFGALTMLLGGGYLLLVLLADRVLGTPTQLGSALVATALVAVGFAPLRSRLQRYVDRTAYGERGNPYGVVTRLGRNLGTQDQRGELAVVVDTLTQTLKLPYAAIVDPSGVVLAEVGLPTAGRGVEHVLTYQGAEVGHLIVSARDLRGFASRERSMLSDIAVQVGAAVHAVRLSTDLQASRLRLVSAKEEERRRLRRDLHDGLGPQLAAMGLKLDAAHSILDARPEDAKVILSDLREDVRGTIEVIRRLVYGMRPPALDELGLVGAVRDCVARFGCAHGLTMHVRAPEQLPALPAAVEVAVFRIVEESVTSVVRHARAGRCDVSIEIDDALVLAICDDGRGLRDRGPAGVGTASMIERAEELGGSLVVGPGPDECGTRVLARLPITPATGAP